MTLTFPDILIIIIGLIAHWQLGCYFLEKFTAVNERHFSCKCSKEDDQ